MYQQTFLNEIASSNADNDERHTTAKEDFNKIKQSLIKANEVLLVIKNQKHKSWMNPKILKEGHKKTKTIWNINVSIRK